MSLFKSPQLALPLLLVALLVPPVEAAPDRPPQLVDYYETWLLSVEHLMLDPERRMFQSLESDVEREVFIRRFWQVRARADGWNATLERWQRHFEVARHRFNDLGSDRARALMRAGSPSRVLRFGGCSGPIRPLEIWTYSRAQAAFLTDRAVDRAFYLVFVSPSTRQAGFYEQWSPDEGLRAIMTTWPGRRDPASIDDLFALAVTRPCGASTLSEMRSVRIALNHAWGAEDLANAVAPPPPDPGWVDELAATLEERGAALPAGPVDFTLIGHFKWYSILRGQVRIPVSEIERNADGHLFDRLVVVGDIWQAGHFAQPFRVVHHVAGPEPKSAAVEIDFYRRVRPGAYTFNLRVEDGRGLALLREEREIEVTWPEEEAVAPAGYRKGFAGLLRPEVGILTTFPSVRLLASGDELIAGEVEIEAVTTGGPIARLDFLLNGEAAGSDGEPPYSVALELGATPEPQVLEAVAYDPYGRRIAYDRAELNVGSPRFDVRLIEPHRDRPSDRVRLAVAVPLEEKLDRVELYLDDERFATLTEPPFVRRLPPGAVGKIYVRAVAYLDSGEEAEDLVIVDSRPVEEIDVELVELYTSVTDAHGRPVLGLTAERFEVFEDGEAQTLERFDTVENLPINVTLLMDVSQSMRDRMRIATVSAERFFQKVLTPKDRASLLTFNDEIRLVVPFTNDIRRLRNGASGLRAWGTTRLNDSVVYTFHYFGGREGKKALVLLSDGHDVDSDFDFEQVLEHALRAGVAAYPIGLGLEHEATGSELARLASETGGRFFAIASASELDRVYRQIEQDLRSQYLLVYRPPEKPRTEFRRVEVKLSNDRLKARTIHGYFP